MFSFTVHSYQLVIILNVCKYRKPKRKENIHHFKSPRKLKKGCCQVFIASENSLQYFFSVIYENLSTSLKLFKHKLAEKIKKYHNEVK